MPGKTKAPLKDRPGHLWVVGVLSLFWNAMGAMDYVMTQTRNESYMSAFTPEQLAFFYGFPAWLIAAWAIAVWGGVLGSLLLLFRSKVAVWCFLISFIAMVVTTIHNFVFSDGLKVIGDPFSLIFSGVIFLIALGLYFYANRLHRKGVLA